MYHVIIELDESRDRSYYHSYIVANGNIECDELPPYADVNKARACYWDADVSTWVYDEEKYAELVAEQEALKEAEEQAKKEAAAVPTNEELAKAVMELANEIANIEEALTELEGIMEGGEA